MVDTDASTKNIFRQVEQIQIADMHHQGHGYFGLLDIGNFGNQVLPNPLVVSDLQNPEKNAQDLQNLYDRVRSDIKPKEIEGPIKKTYITKLRINLGEYAWADDGGIIRNDGPTMLYLLFKITNPAKRIGASNLKYEIEKSTLAKFGNNVKDLLDGMYSNNSIIIDKG